MNPNCTRCHGMGWYWAELTAYGKKGEYSRPCPECSPEQFATWSAAGEQGRRVHEKFKAIEAEKAKPITELAVGDNLRIDVEGCPPRVLNDYRFPRVAHVVSFNEIDGKKYVTIGWSDGWQVGVSADVAIRMREAALQEEPTMSIAEALEKEKEIFQDLERRRTESRNAEGERQWILSTYPADEISGIPCDLCGGDVIEFSIPSDIWNKVIRLDGHEHDKEYLCMVCFFDALRKALGLANGN